MATAGRGLPAVQILPSFGPAPRAFVAGVPASKDLPDLRGHGQRTIDIPQAHRLLPLETSRSAASLAPPHPAHLRTYFDLTMAAAL